MYPYLFNFIPTYGFCIAIGLIAAFALLRVFTRKKQISDSDFSFYGMALIVSVIVGFIFARLFQIIYNLIETGKVGTGITFMGGLVGGIAAFALYVWIFGKKYKTSLFSMVNCAAPCIVVAHSFGRLGCFFAGCCYGKEWEHGISFVTAIANDTWIYGPKRIPTQLIEAAFLAILAIVLIIVLLKTKGNFVMSIYLYSYAVFRFFIEYLRDDHRGAFILGLSPSQWQSIIMIIGATLLTVYLYKRRSKEQTIQSNGITADEPNDITTDELNDVIADEPKELTDSDSPSANQSSANQNIDFTD